MSLKSKSKACIMGINFATNGATKEFKMTEFSFLKMTHEEALELQKDDKKYALIKMKTAMEAGVCMMETPLPPTMPELDTKSFYNCGDYYFENRDDALAVRDFIYSKKPCK